MTDDFRGRNDASRERLRALVGRLTPAELERRVGDGDWSVKALLAHLAFWDRYAAVVLAWWEQEGFSAPASLADVINAAALPGWQALPADFVLRDVLAAAEAIDARAAAASPELVTLAASGGRARFFDRGIHRNEHIDQIEGAGSA